MTRTQREETVPSMAVASPCEIRGMSRKGKRPHHHRIVFLDRSILPDGVQLRPPRFSHEWQEYATTSPEEVVARLQGATIALTNRVKIGARELNMLPSLRLIGVAATGYDVIDLIACGKYGVAVTNLREWCTASVAEHVFSLILALRRRLLPQYALVQNGAWRCASGGCLVTRPFARDLHSSTLGIVGSGAIGRHVAMLGKAFGMTVIESEHRGKRALRLGRVAFEEVLRSSDVVSLHCPLTEETRGLIGEAELTLMQPHSIFINCARGGLVNDAALAEALGKGRIAGAGLDGLSIEPPRLGNPLLDLQLPNLLITPHVAWASEQAIAAFGEQLIANLEAFVQGRPQNLIV